MAGIERLLEMTDIDPKTIPARRVRCHRDFIKACLLAVTGMITGHGHLLCRRLSQGGMSDTKLSGQIIEMLGQFNQDLVAGDGFLGVMTRFLG